MTARIPSLIAQGELQEAEVLIAEALTAGLLARERAAQLRKQIAELKEQKSGTGRAPPPTDASSSTTDVFLMPGPSCGTRFPAYPLCQDLPSEYTYPSQSAALAALKAKLGQKNLALHADATARQGPCAGIGNHYNVRLNGERMGSITCCPCCVDMAHGPIEWKKCRVVW